MKQLNAIVVGVGNMGQNHARIYSQHPRIDLVAVVDKNKIRAKTISRKFKVKNYYTNLKTCLNKEKIDLASLVLPPQLNLEIASLLLTKKTHLLIEKPLALSIVDAKKIVRAVKKAGVKVAVGHTERFNPAVRMAKKIISNNLLGKIKYIRAQRIGVPTPRTVDVNIVLDIGTHDIDVFNYLMDALPTKIQADGRCAFGDQVDVANINFNYLGVLVHLELNKISTIKRRTLELFGTRGFLEIDYILQTVNFHPRQEIKKHSDFKSLLSKYGFRPDTVKIDVKFGEPLKLEIDDFIEAIIKNRQPQVTPEKALAVIKIATQVVNSFS